MIKAQALFFPDRGKNGEWIGVISEKLPGDDQITILDVGIELTEENMRRWINDAIKNKPWEENGIPTPDYHDRKKMI